MKNIKQTYDLLNFFNFFAGGGGQSPSQFDQ